MSEIKRVGIAFQGGGFPAGAIGAGVMKYLVEQGAFEKFDIDVFSGTSAGALVASVCWGHKLKGTIAEIPETLEKQWLHFALGLIPNAKVAQMSQLFGELAQMNPVNRYASDHLIVPILRHLMEKWVLTYIPVDELMGMMLEIKKDESSKVPGLALGSAEILTGEIKVFTENDFCLEAILASGSLDEVNGLTTIDEGPNQGIYCDGAWGTNPPMTPLIKYGIDELWLVEVFPKVRDEIPKTPGERKDRKDELWQNSLVEHELDDIERINAWLASGRLKNTDTDEKQYRHIEVKKMPMTLDLPAGAAFVNSPSFIKRMMTYGHNHAHVFLAE